VKTLYQSQRRRPHREFDHLGTKHENDEWNQRSASGVQMSSSRLEPRIPCSGLAVPPASNDRAQWLAKHILPLEPQLRGWIARNGSKFIEADDLIQQAYARLATLASVSEIEQPKAYLYKVVKSLLRDKYRHEKIVSIESVADIAELSPHDETGSPERILSGHQDLERLFRAINALPALAKAVFVLKKFDELSQRDIAARLHISENVVEKRMSQAVRTIASNISSPDDEDILPASREIPVNRFFRSASRHA
jgi:RNA polymerase sigma factor (sigma-70 family)